MKINSKSLLTAVFSLSAIGAGAYLFVNATAPTAAPVVVNKDKYKVITETPGAIKDALDKAVDYASDAARSSTIKNNMILYRRNGLPFRIEIPLLGGENVVLDSTDFVMDTCSGKLGCNYRYRESMSVNSYTDAKTKVIYSNLFSRKENWFSNDKPVGVDDANSVVTNSTVYETAYPAADGVAMISGTVLQGAGFKVACDTPSGICAIDGTTLSTADVMGFWSQFNRPTSIYTHFVKTGLTSDEAEDLLAKLKALSGTMEFRMLDDSNQEVLKVGLKKASIAGFRMDNMSPVPLAASNVTNAPSVTLANSKYYVHIWINSNAVTLPCIYKRGCSN